MTTAYLWLNSALYVLFALWCTFKPESTSQSLGYLQLSNSGRSEYLVIYGGLQVGLALFFALCAHRPGWREAGIAFAALLYAPIVAYRCWTVVQHHPVASLTIATGVLEAALLAGAVFLWLRLPEGAAAR